MPGMSRTVAPRACYQNVTPQLLAGQIIGLMDELSIPVATFYGCSSGGATVLALVANHPARVRSGIVHEVPFTLHPHLAALTSLSDAEIVAACRNIYFTGMNEDEAAFRELGSEYHSRLDRNYITWVRNYVTTISPNLREEGLTKRPITWTIGALTPAGAFFENVKIACRCGIDIGLLPCMHFPQVSIPEKLALHIQEAAMKY
ncbi:hypothetical protein Asppvi_001700 [Aspergillus pseudoviridinutans]|uniref:Alpha/Beta hydrolase protein n=1 Tax=Aspergillus pseudoviridinutans TaxID=1517512 RepID=A0A9P3B8M1_9EURO|nr:uncharacterized protein Asppvi_001700 [Aspergillus pseudoviridinutans]GIJ83181.1 hypothetical protein Asppvi_001700 [Aspergillus pseudoviridinutans]